MTKQRKKLRIPDQPVHTLKQFREEFGMSQVQLAVFLKKSRSYVSLMENGTRMMTTAVIAKIEKHRQEVGDAMKLNDYKSLTSRTHLEPLYNDLLAKLKSRLAILEKREFDLQDLKKDIDNKNLLALNAHERLAVVFPDDVQPDHELVFKLSRIKTTDRVKNFPFKAIELNIKLELVQAEAEILRKYLKAMENRVDEE